MPESDALSTQPVEAAAPAPESLAIPGPRDFDAEIAEAVRAANEEAAQLQAEDSAAEGSTQTPPADTSTASPAHPTPDAEPGDEGAAEEGTETPSASRDAPPPEGASLAEQLRLAGISRAQREKVHEIIAAQTKAAAAEAIEAQKRADEQKAHFESQTKQQQEAAEKANAGLQQFLGDNEEFTKLQTAYDRDELWGDDKARYVELRDRRLMVPVLRQRLWESFDRDLRVSDEIEGVEPGLWNGKAENLRDYATRIAQGVAVATASKRDAEWRTKESDWKARHEDLEGQLEERTVEVTSLKTQLAAKSPSPEPGGRPAASRSAALQTLWSQATNDDDFFEKAVRGEFAGADLSDR